jgi:hypothetical protein
VFIQPLNRQNLQLVIIDVGRVDGLPAAPLHLGFERLRIGVVRALGWSLRNMAIVARASSALPSLNCANDFQ